MRFGGHETFPIREGWLHKGLKLLQKSPEVLASDSAQDWLGVGRNMVKSIRHWLLATGLAERLSSQTAKATGLLMPTPLGALIAERDEYFLEPGTWWFLHINLVHRRDHAYTWWWFFNYFHRERFERSVCIEGLRRFLQLHESRAPGARTQQRDVSCLLSSYARHYPPHRTDPEDGAECPFIELGLLDYFRESGTFRSNGTNVDTLPPEVLCFAIARKFVLAHEPDRAVLVSVRDAATQECSAGRVLRMDPERLHDAAVRASSVLDTDAVNVQTQAGERVIAMQSVETVHWARRYYDRSDRRTARAA